ncbi:MAG: YfcE family phosphodiesterase [Bacillota bacterium]
MRLGLISDTHGELENLREAIRQLTREHNVDKIVHLGDEWEDGAVFKELPAGVETLRVPGIYAREYQDPAIQNRVVREIAGWRILFTHTPAAAANDLPGDPDPAELAAAHEIDVVAYGHTHIPSVEEKDQVLWINPGHLKTLDKKGRAPSYAVLAFREGEVEVRIIDLNSREAFVRQTFSKKKITLYTAGLKLRGVLNSTETARKIWDALPVGGRVSLWGEEIYFHVPVAAELENGQETVRLGDIGYWPPGRAVCFFFGPTPVSAGEEIRPYSPVTVVGKMVDDPKQLKAVEDKEAVKIVRGW